LDDSMGLGWLGLQLGDSWARHGSQGRGTGSWAAVDGLSVGWGSDKVKQRA